MVSIEKCWGLTLFLSVNLTFDFSMMFSNWMADGEDGTAAAGSLPRGAREFRAASLAAGARAGVTGGVWAAQAGMAQSRQRANWVAKAIPEPGPHGCASAMEAAAWQLERVRSFRRYGFIRT